MVCEYISMRQKVFVGNNARVVMYMSAPWVMQC